LHWRRCCEDGNGISVCVVFFAEMQLIGIQFGLKQNIWVTPMLTGYVPIICEERAILTPFRSLARSPCRIGASSTTRMKIKLSLGKYPGGLIRSAYFSIGFGKSLWGMEPDVDPISSTLVREVITVRGSTRLVDQAMSQIQQRKLKEYRWHIYMMLWTLHALDICMTLFTRSRRLRLHPLSYSHLP